MSKITLTNLVNLQSETTAVNAVNTNNAALTTAINNTLSRDGTQPNTMGSTLDMNSNRIINLPTAISTSEPVTLAQMDAALVANGNINTGLTGVPVSAAMQPVVNSSTIASAKSQLGISTFYIDASLPPYNVVGDGVTDNSAGLQAAITAAAGAWVILPSGTIVLKSQVSYVTNTLFAPGLRMCGQGVEKTIIDNQVSNNSCIYVAGAPNLFQLGSILRDFTIKTTTSPSNSNGIEHFACYQYIVENVYIHGLTGDGCRITANLGDADGCNEMWYRNCLIWQCNIGINCNFAPTVVQPSFFRVDNCDIQFHTIGIRWIGLQGTVINTAIAENTQYGLYIVNNSSSNAQFTLISTSFEDNAVSARIDALQGGSFIGMELAQGTVGSGIPISTQAVVINGSTGVNFQDTRVRISSTPHTLWTFDSTCFYNSISNSFYQNYDNAGQTRYSYTSGIATGNIFDDSMDGVRFGQSNGVYFLTCVNGSNENLALPITGGIFTLAGPTGAFNIGGLTNGFDGRRLTILNTSGQTLTVKADASTSTAANRINADNLTNITVNNGGSFTLVYSGPAQRWYLIGKG